MAQQHTLDEGANFFTAVGSRFPAVKRSRIKKAAQLVAEEAKRVLGTYDYGWPKLKPATIARKATGDSPLLETGELRDSIQFSVKDDSTAYVGSNDPVALYQELGTSRIPPRSFLAGAAKRKEEECHKLCGHDLFEAVFSRNPYIGEG
jgi:phage gpG-like protein